jgi:uncharacterized membrane protein YciS (DUF1049 family)
MLELLTRYDGFIQYFIIVVVSVPLVLSRSVGGEINQQYSFPYLAGLADYDLAHVGSGLVGGVFVLVVSQSWWMQVNEVGGAHSKLSKG